MIKELTDGFKNNLIKYITQMGFENTLARKFYHYYSNFIRELDGLVEMQKAALYNFVVDNFNSYGSFSVEKQAASGLKSIEEALGFTGDIFSSTEGYLKASVEAMLNCPTSSYHMYRNIEKEILDKKNEILEYVAEDKDFFMDLNEHLFLTSPSYKLINDDYRFNLCLKSVLKKGEKASKEQISNLLEAYDIYFDSLIEDRLDEKTNLEFQTYIHSIIEKAKKTSKELTKTQEKMTSYPSSSAPISTTKTQAEKIISKVFKDYAGFKEIKDELLKIIARRVQNGETEKPHTIVLTGNPGTGKSTVAELMSKVLSQSKVLPNGVFKKFTAAELQAEYVGQTIPKMNKMFEECRGGTIFLDEFDSLNSNESFCKEIVKKLLFELENPANKNTLIVIAGYDDRLKAFFDADAGLKSRFQRKFHIKDYSFEELVEIENKILNKLNYHMYPEAQKLYEEDLKKQMQTKNFGNGRFVSSSLDSIIDNQTMRAWEENDKQDRCIELQDVELYIKHRDKNVTKETPFGFTER